MFDCTGIVEVVDSVAPELVVMVVVEPLVF